MKDRLEDIAIIAHSGGLMGVSQEKALVLIRRLTLEFWDKGLSKDRQIERLARAIEAGS